VELTPAPRLHLAVHTDDAALDERPRLAARVGDARELEELTEPDRVAADLDVTGHVWVPAGRVRTLSLSHGTLTVPDPDGRVVRHVRVAPAAHDACVVR